MESENANVTSLTVTELKGRGGDFVELEDGATYEAEYKNLKVFMDNSPWGVKKTARLFFQITRGKFKGSPATFKGTFFKDDESGAWVIGSKSKLAEAIKSLTGGNTIDESHKGKKVLITIKNTTSKDGKVYSNVSNIIPSPVDDDEAEVPALAKQETKKTVNVGGTPKQEAVPAGDSGLLDDLTELSDFTE